MTRNRQWTSKEDSYLQAHIIDMSVPELAKALNRSINAIYNRKGKLGLTNLPHPKRERIFLYREDLKNNCKTWTKEDEDFLESYWGKIAITTIAKRLGRSQSAIKIRASRLGLGPALMAGDYVTFNQFVIAFQGTKNAGSYQVESWIKKRGFPIHTKRVQDSSFRIVYLDEFWDWAKKHRSFLDFSRMEPLALGEEPEQRRKDFQAFSLQRKYPWTPEEDQRLQHLLKQHKYGYAELSEILRRSEGAIVRRCMDLGLKERPVRADNHGKDSVWTEADFQALADGIRHGDSYSMIGKAVRRSEKAVRGKVYFTYLTEDADKVRSMIQDGPWGYGAPEPTVRQGFNLSRTKTEVRKNLSILDAILRKRMNDLGWDEYWQRDTCQHWNAIRGCLMHCSDCDSCTKFQRIRPQYCRMCGGEFLERHEQTFCPKCRTMRKKQAQRKYAVLHARGRL